MSSTRLDEILLFALPVVVIVVGLLWNIGRAIDRVARKLERLAEAQEKSLSKPKE
jgi:cytochrome c-type biogenesis protein CcmH/NrfF